MWSNDVPRELNFDPLCMIALVWWDLSPWSCNWKRFGTRFWFYKCSAFCWRITSSTCSYSIGSHSNFFNFLFFPFSQFVVNLNETFNKTEKVIQSLNKVGGKKFQQALAVCR